MPMSFLLTRRLTRITLSALLALGVSSVGLAGDIEVGDATMELGRDLLIDEATPGGGDMTAEQPEKLVGRVNFAAINALNVGNGGTRITVTGIAWASPNAPEHNDATTVTVEIRYLGTDGEGGNKDDIVLGSATATLKYQGAGEYVWLFDEPITGVVDGRNSHFRIDLSPANDAGNGSLRVKAVAGSGPKFSVAGKSEAVSE